jgi:A/G-specific adenine glycosylase
VLAFAFEADHGVLDVNAGRVLARVAGRPLGPKEAQASADGLVPQGRSWEWNQAVLDLGATVCTGRRPRCEECPLAADCRWRAAGLPEPDPARSSAATGRRQSRFDGSDRQGRGRLVSAARRGPVPLDSLASAAGWPDDEARAHRVLADLLADGLVAVADGVLTLS